MRGHRGFPSSQLEVPLSPGNLARPDLPGRPVSERLSAAGLPALHCVARTAALGRSWDPPSNLSRVLEDPADPERCWMCVRLGRCPDMRRHSSGRLADGSGVFPVSLAFL